MARTAEARRAALIFSRLDCQDVASPTVVGVMADTNDSTVCRSCTGEVLSSESPPRGFDLRGGSIGQCSTCYARHIECLPLRWTCVEPGWWESDAGHVADLYCDPGPLCELGFPHNNCGGDREWSVAIRILGVNANRHIGWYSSLREAQKAAQEDYMDGRDE